MDLPTKPFAPNPQHSTSSGPLAGVLRDELNHARDHAQQLEQELAKQGKPQTSPVLAELRHHITTLQAGLESTEAPICGAPSDRTRTSEDATSPSRNALR